MDASSVDTQSVKKTYKRLSVIYNTVSRMFCVNQGRKTIVNTINDKYKARSAEVLEVGVGTGLSLPYYSKHHHVRGIDFSNPMLKKARELVRCQVCEDDGSRGKPKS